VIGVCLDMKQPYVITEFIDGEPLRDVVRRAAVSQDSTLSWPSKIKMVDLRTEYTEYSVLLLLTQVRFDCLH